MKHLVLFENYPYGSENDPNAPWNKKDPHVNTGKNTMQERFRTVSISDEVAILKDSESEDFYVLSVDNIDKNDLYEYGDLEYEIVGRDEDGDPEYEYDYDNFEVDNGVINGYVNNNIDKISRGEGLDDFESGKLFVKIDEELMNELMITFKVDPKIFGIPPMKMIQVK